MRELKGIEEPHNGNVINLRILIQYDFSEVTKKYKF